MKNTFKILSLLFFLVGCSFFTSEDSKKLTSMNEELVRINNSLKNKKIVLAKEVHDEVFKNNKSSDYSMVIYYDANCSICFTQLKKWKDLINYFKEVDENLNIKFVLYSDDQIMTDINLKNEGFPKSLVVYDTKNEFLREYQHATTKAYNTMLLNNNNEIIFIGSPLLSNNLKKYYTEIITN